MADANRFAGKARLLQRFDQIPGAVKAAARFELENQADGLVGAIKPRVPVDHGDLRESVEWHRGTAQGKIAVVVTEGADDDTQGRKARAVEFGRPDMQAQPHFFPTYRSRKRKIRAAVGRAIRNAVRRFWGG